MSVNRIDPWLFLFRLNEYRLHRKLRYITISNLLEELSTCHCREILLGHYPFSLQGDMIRRNKLSGMCVRIREIMARLNLPRDELEELVKNESTRKILEEPYNICGITIFDIGTVRYIHIILGETA